MFIGGEAVALPERERRTIENPASGQPVDTVPVGTPEDVDRAVQAASAAFIPWWETSAARRGEIVHHGARLVHDHIGDLSRLLTDEQGKPLRESRLEIHRFVLTLEHYAGMAKNLRGAYVPNLDKDTYGLVTEAPARRRRRDRPVELPDDAAVQQARAGARGRQHDGGQAGRHDAADHAADRRAAARGGAAEGRASTSSPAAGRSSARRS